MKEVNLQGISNALEQVTNAQTRDKNSGGNDFENVLLESINKVNKLQVEANKAVQDLAAGKNESIHETMIAMEKASISFQMMMQIRNKIIDAYQEILKTAM